MPEQKQYVSAGSCLFILAAHAYRCMSTHNLDGVWCIKHSWLPMKQCHHGLTVAAASRIALELDDLQLLLHKLSCQHVHIGGLPGLFRKPADRPQQLV